MLVVVYEVVELFGKDLLRLASYTFKSKRSSVHILLFDVRINSNAVVSLYYLILTVFLEYRVNSRLSSINESFPVRGQYKIGHAYLAP